MSREHSGARKAQKPSPVGPRSTRRSSPPAAVTAAAAGAAPAAKAPGTVTKKRPAAAIGKALRLKYKVKWEAGDEKRTRNTFTCKHYNRADTVFKNIHPKAAPEDRKASLGVIYSAASELYSKKMRVSK